MKSLALAASLMGTPDIYLALEDPAVAGGSGTHISLERNTVLVADVLYSGKNCRSAELAFCIANEYVTVAYPVHGASSWSGGGYSFEVVDHAHLAKCQAPEGAQLIYSHQGGSELTFYWSAQAGLLGWARSGANSSFAREECWLRVWPPGKHPAGANNSSKPTPLRGAA